MPRTHLSCVVGLLFVALCVQSTWAQDVDCSDHAHCDSCVAYESALGVCRWCTVDTQCHDPHSPEDPCQTVITNATQCVPLPACQSPTNPDSYDEADALNMIAWSGAAYLANPASYQYFPDNCYVNSTFTGTTDGGTTVFGFAGIDSYNQRIVIAFQGTADTDQLITEMLDSSAVSVPALGSGVTVAEYFLDAHNALWDQSSAALTALQADYPGYAVYVTGHSLGGALASLFSIFITVNNVIYGGDTPVVYTFGQPRVGDYAYSVAHLQAVPLSFRLVNNRDPVPHLPPEGSESITSPESKSWKAQAERARARTAAARAEKRAARKDRTATTQTADSILYAFHHGWEVWYPGGEYQNGVMCGNRFCCGSPYGEDPACSDQLTFDCGDLYKFCIGDHHGYFNLLPNGYCQLSSQATARNTVMAKAGQVGVKP